MVCVLIYSNFYGDGRSASAVQLYTPTVQPEVTVTFTSGTTHNELRRVRVPTPSAGSMSPLHLAQASYLIPKLKLVSCGILILVDFLKLFLRKNYN